MNWINKVGHPCYLYQYFQYSLPVLVFLFKGLVGKISIVRILKYNIILYYKFCYFHHSIKK